MSPDELRALADQLVPEEPTPPRWVPVDSPSFSRWYQRHETRRQLLAMADQQETDDD